MKDSFNNSPQTPDRQWVLCKPLAIDLYCGLGGWAEGFLSEGWRVIGFDIERHDYGTGIYPGQLVIQDVRTLHGSQFKNAAVIVASPPCQAYSYRAMPWKRAKALPPPDNELFEQPFRIQREACEAAGRYIPLIVENVRGAQKWVGLAKWHFGSYYIWGDVPALMPIAFGQKFNPDGTNHGQGSWFAIADSKNRGTGIKNGGDWFGSGDNCSLQRRFSGTKQSGISVPRKNGKGNASAAWFQDGAARCGSQSIHRRRASAQIAKVPFPLAQHIARVFKPVLSSLLLVALLTPPQRAHMFGLAGIAQKSYTQLPLNFEPLVTGAESKTEVTSHSTEPAALPAVLAQIAKKHQSFTDRVMARLSEAERREINTHYQADYRQSWICLSFANRGIAEPFVSASYQMYGIHPDKVWERIVADRKARLGAEYFEWYSSDDILRPDVPRLPPHKAESTADGAALSTGMVGGSVPNPRKEIV